jgi:hypothetical protein
MASPETLGTIRARALDLADMTNSNFPVAARVADYINSAAAELYDILVNSYSQYFLSTQTITLVSGTEDYTLPSDFYKSKRVFYIAGGRRFSIHPFNLESLDGAKSSPLTAGSVELWYVPEMSLMTAEDDTIAASIPPIIKGWPEFIALGAAIKLLNREESDATGLMVEKQQMRQRLIEMAEPRDAGIPDRVQDVGHRWDSIGYSYDPGAYLLRYRIMGPNIKFIQYDAGV